MEKSKHEYELEIQNLEQQLIEVRKQFAESIENAKDYGNGLEKELIEANRIIKRMAKIIEILLDKLEREEK